MFATYKYLSPFEVLKFMHIGKIGNIITGQFLDIVCNEITA